ncbi:unnamed protein product [Gongylonema pulchrum]|uniref:Uncharacterized protein n=1 Tax=Gongylonema pulchrum TaxID=637853 RepID=A0A3P7MM15_9BILA|nr:unnamed protein product [Gongylonema pulchrum]
MHFRYIELFSAADVPIAQKYVTYRRIGGTARGTIGAAPSLDRIGFHSLEDWAEKNASAMRTQGKPLPLSRTDGIAPYASGYPASSLDAANPGYNASTSFNASSSSSNYPTTGQQFSSWMEAAALLLGWLLVEFVEAMYYTRGNTTATYQRWLVFLLQQGHIPIPNLQCTQYLFCSERDRGRWLEKRRIYKELVALRKRPFVNMYYFK